MMTYYMMPYMQELNVILYAVIFVLSPSSPVPVMETERQVITLFFLSIDGQIF